MKLVRTHVPIALAAAAIAAVAAACGGNAETGSSVGAPGVVASPGAGPIPVDLPTPADPGQIGGAPVAEDPIPVDLPTPADPGQIGGAPVAEDPIPVDLPTPADPGQIGGAPGGVGMPIDQAVVSPVAGPVLVSGHLVVVGGETRLCSLLLESYPPQCGGTSVVVEGLDLGSLPDELVTEGEVTWSKGMVSLLGELDGERLVVSPTSLG